MSKARRATDQVLEANRKFMKQVSDLVRGLEETGMGISERAQARMDELRANLNEQQGEVMPRLKSTLSKIEEQRERATPMVRRAITGNEALAVEEWLNKYTVVKTIDKVTYVLSIVFLQSTQYISMRFPEYFRFFFAAATIFLLSTRIYMYGKQNMQYFMYDYCYMTNTLCVINALAQPQNAYFWQVNFVAANGPLLGAIVAWRNSLVFHDVDKVTSFFIHFVPALLTYAERWSIHPTPMCPNGASSCTLSFMTAFVAPFTVYLIWQVAYLFITEYLDRDKFEKDPSLMTSLRWIVRDKKNQVHVLMLTVGRQLGIFEADEELDFKRKPMAVIGLFVVFQLIFTIACFLPTSIMFISQNVHRVFIVVVAIIALWNGAGFLFHVFVKRYEEGLQKKSEASRRKSSRNSMPRRTSSSSGSKRKSKARMKGFCAPPNEAERELLRREKEALEEALLANVPEDDNHDEDQDYVYRQNAKRSERKSAKAATLEPSDDEVADDDDEDDNVSL
ncbi:Membrane transporter, putative [Hondaea fermentalgiana]|uniref:Glycerophosphocholine acyltransferase 1 n=1 Tax=Hondaea fermentalgiana TaxID=2315210 RepID=A0A2R5GRF1_9STRA|nr:Membrane transporter, putative [Hondaea fermentalgiana]|eukprot:GBG30921.1 Membrane transporter, putative [Hondaea fermentalgiana]